VGVEVEELKHYIEGEKNKNMLLDSENRRLNAKISTLEDLLKQEKDRLLLKERQVEEHARQRDLM
jgi:hypothetical protein